jgi:hypothetical protein
MLWKRALCVSAGLFVATALNAQSWNESRVRDLVQRATDRRVRQLTDNGLTGYQATAHGYVTFLAQIGVGFRELPRVVKADELALEVYWRAPNQSKQRIVGRRDTTLLPTDIEYHQDHLGIVQNNFPAIIRIGDGDEVRDVPHPLSASGLEQYEFALSDSLRITTPGRVIDVYEIKVRPKDDQQPRFVGAVYLDRESAQVVRMAFGFTRPAYLDKQLEDVFVVLENGVVGGRFWLPRKQEIEIRRTVTWLDYPVRGIIRGRWDIGEYNLTEAPSTQFFGPEIVQAPPSVLQRYTWPPGRLTDSIPEESRLPTPDEIKRTMDEVRRLARARVTQRGRLSLLAHGASDFVRHDRTSGLALGSGLSARLGPGLTAEGFARYAFGAQRWRGGMSFGWQSAKGEGLRVFSIDDVRDAGDVAERSTVLNSLASQEFGSDFTDYYRVKGGGISGAISMGLTRWTLSFVREEQRPLSVSVKPFSGSYRPAFEAAFERRDAAIIALDVPSLEWRGLVLNGGGEFRSSTSSVGAACGPGPVCASQKYIRRTSLRLEAQRSAGAAVVEYRAYGGIASGARYLFSQDLIFVGGPVSAPGFGYHELVGDRAIAQNLELRFPVPFLRLSLGRFGRAPGKAWIAPHVTVVGMHRVDSTVTIARGSGAAPVPDPFRATATGWYRSAGVSVISLFDLVRLDLSRALPDGKWRFSIDVSHPFWSIM